MGAKGMDNTDLKHSFTFLPIFRQISTKNQPDIELTNTGVARRYNSDNKEKQKSTGQN